MALSQRLKDWGGEDIHELGEIYDQYSSTDAFVPDLLSLLDHPDLQIGASWLLKRHLEKDNRLSDTETGEVFALASKLVAWEARLHFLQCIPLLNIPVQSVDETERFLRLCLTEENKFVRAWAIGGFIWLAEHFPEYRGEVSGLVESAYELESPAVKARIRNASKNTFLSA